MATLIEHQVKIIIKNFDAVCDLAKVTQIDRKLFMSRQFLNPYAFENLNEEGKDLIAAARTFWSRK